MGLDTAFFVMDETKCVETDVFAVTGIVVPASAANPVREEVYAFLHELQRLPPRTHNMQPPELHGRTMLQRPAKSGTKPELIEGMRREDQLACFSKVVDVVNLHQLQVVRVAYFMKSLVHYKHPADFYGLCFGGMLLTIDPILSSYYLIPVMDGFDTHVVAQFSNQVQSLSIMNSHPDTRGRSSILHSENVLDVTFVNSRYSALMQVADVIAYLLHLRDWRGEGLDVSDFKAEVLAVSDRLAPELVTQSHRPIWMNHLPKAPSGGP